MRNRLYGIIALASGILISAHTISRADIGADLILNDPILSTADGIYISELHALAPEAEPKRAATIRPSRGYDLVAQTLSDCEAHHSDTVGMDHCLSDAYASYDKVLNVVYRRVLASSDPGTKEAVVEAQRKWVAFRDAERKAQSAWRKTEGGTIMGIVFGIHEITEIRERISELTMYTGIGNG